MSYAVHGDVQARIPYRTIGASSKPSQSDVTTWLAEAQAMLDGALAGAGLPAPYTDSAAVLQLKSWVCDYAEGLVRKAYAAAGGAGDNDDGKDLLEKFEARLKDIAARPAVYERMLSPASTASTTTQVRASNADGALEPEFTRGMSW